jgi:peptidoglycan/LPS O-acetylase OafA/YrhL
MSNEKTAKGCATRPAFDFSQRIPELDGLRGLAIGMVLYYHSVTLVLVVRPDQMLRYFQTTTRVFVSGVDLFFVLSGFLIGGILLDARESPNYFKTFYVRRICRILPLYFLFIVLVGLAYRFVYGPIGAPLNWLFAGRLPWYTYLSFTQNLWMSKLNTIGATILSVTWSLSVEEQFYLVLPLLIRFVRRSALPYVFLAGVAIPPALRFCLASMVPNSFWATYTLLPCRMDPMFLGALCAFGLRQPGIWSQLARQRRALWIMLSLLVPGMLAFNIRSFDSPQSGNLRLALGFSCASLFYATVLLLAVTNSRSYLSRTLRWRLLSSLGAVAYSVYLFHEGVVFLCISLLGGYGFRLASWNGLGVTVLAVATTIAFGKLSWRYFEKPFVSWGYLWKY